jgi:phosphoglycerate dehydrogenase-like enzyme
MTKRILVLPKPSLYRQLFSSDSDMALRRLGEVTFNVEERDWESAELAGKIAPYDVVITGWRSPRFTEEVLRSATSLKLIAHSAGSVKFMLSDSALDRGFDVTCVAAAMGQSVAEFGLQLVMMFLRPIHTWDRQMKDGEDWKHVKTLAMGRDLAGQRVGVIGAGHVGRTFIRILRALDVEVWAYDPYLTVGRALEMNVRKVDTLDELMKECRIVALQAPSTPATHKMIGRRELKLMPDGGIFINTARSWCVDEQALLDELKTGRISCGIDVYDEEPLPADSGFRKLDNVILTPHAAAQTYDCRYRQGEWTVAEVRRFVNGEPLKHKITPEIMAIMA